MAFDPNAYDDLIQSAANQYNVNPKLLKATMLQESEANPNAVGPTITLADGTKTNARGLMQFIPSTAKQYGVDVNDPKSSIFGGARYLSDLLDQNKNNIDAALAHYGGYPGQNQAYAQNYGGLIRKRYDRLPDFAPSKAAASSSSSSDSGLPPGVAAAISGKPAPAPAPTPAPDQNLPPGVRTAITQPTTAPATTTTPQGQSDRLTALGTGGRQGIATVLNSPSAWFGWNPLVNPNLGTLTPDEQASLRDYPITSAVGRVAGEAIPTTAAAVAAAPFIPEIGTGLLPMALRGVATGGLFGGAQGALTAGENFRPGAPQESTWDRIRKGAEWGAAFGGAGESLGWLGGMGETISPEVQKAGQQMSGAGVDVAAANLPRQGGQAFAKGAPATEAQAKQVSTAWGRDFLGESTPDFSDVTLNRVINKLGQGVDSAVRAGKIDVGATGLDAALSKIEATTSPNARPMISRIIADIRGSVGPNGEIAGNDVGDILKTGNMLDKATRSRTGEIEGPAVEIESAIKQAFENSSPPGIGTAYRLAREKYKLALVAENAADNTTGQLNPANLLSSMQRLYPDSKYLGSGGTASDAAVTFARNASRLFGGSAPVTSLRDLAGPGALSGLGAVAAHYMPQFADNPLMSAVAVGAPIASRLARGVVEKSPQFAQNLLTRGARGMSPYAAALSAPTAGAYGR